MAVTVVNNENFKNEVLKADKPVLVDFWATWCGPCRMMAPVVEAIAEEHPELKVCKVDIDENPELERLPGWERLLERFKQFEAPFAEERKTVRQAFRANRTKDPLRFLSKRDIQFFGIPDKYVRRVRKIRRPPQHGLKSMLHLAQIPRFRRRNHLYIHLFFLAY